MEDEVDKLNGFEYFNTLDLYSGYYQIEMEKDSISKTAFITCDKHYQIKRMPFGLTNAPSIFQRLINKIFTPLGSTVASADLEKKLEVVFKTLRENNLTLNPKKWQFFQPTINYLGIEISKNGVRLGKSKIKAVKNFPIPASVPNVRQFLGLCGFFR